MRRFPVRCLSRRHAPVVTALLFAFVAVNLAQADSFPYEARIAVPGAPIRSGPGEEFYITDTLAEGETVEVYRHRHNGWCAVRPTEGSFSWVFGPHVRLLDDSLAEIDKPDVASRIGSRLSRQRNAVQVRFKKGEVVQVLEEADEDGQKWYKIAPPAGEFRWIHSSCLRRADGAPEPLRTVSRSTPTEEAMESGPQQPVERPIVTVAATEAVPPTPADNWRAAPIAPPLATIATPPPATPVTSTALPATTASPAASTPLPAATQSPAPATTPPNISVADGLSRQLTDVELRLSRMVSEPPTSWQIEPLEREAESLLNQAQTVAERDAVKVTLEKLDRFAAIQRRHQQLASASLPNAATTAATTAAINAPITPLADTAGGQFDAVGVLRPVVSKRPGAPQFALVDQRGQVVSFVSPTPDLNLQPFVGHRVGIVGNRGFIPEFHRAHVTAGRVTPLDQNLLR
ncbi:MAG: hypothetical protein WD468_10100 [Pirellulales bacterium]